MMNDPFQFGLDVVLGGENLYLLLFIIVLLSSYKLQDFKDVFILLTLLSVGFFVLLVTPQLYEFIQRYVYKDIGSFFKIIIPIIILSTSLYNVFVSYQKRKLWVYSIIAVLIGVILSYYNYDSIDSFDPVLKLFVAIGIEVGLLIVSVILLVLNFVLKKIPGINQRYWTHYLNYLGIIISGYFIWNQLF